MRFLLLCILALAGTANFGNAQVITVSEARQLPLGTVVEVQGIITNGSELGEIRYLQDQTAGIGIYPGSGSVSGFENEVRRGDEIMVRGELTDFQGLLEISPILSFEVLSRNNPLPPPEPVTLIDFDEDLEGRLVSVFGVYFEDGGDIFDGGNTYEIFDGTDTRRIYIRNGHPLEGETIPIGSLEMTGILSQFIGYQLLPRDQQDIRSASNLFIDSDLNIMEQRPDGFTLSWSSSVAADSKLAYGLTEVLSDTIQLAGGIKNDHQVEVTGLEPAQFYFVQAIIERDGELSYSPKKFISTASTSSGAIEVYFTQAVNEAFSEGRIPDGQSGAEIEAAIIQKIDQARETVDFCAYNISREDIVDALARAELRGVRVRYIYNIGTSNSALPANPVFPILGQNSSGLMHNKFVVIDSESPDDALVITGSMNFTDMNVFTDYNNTLMIQDQALARTYEKEFNEMWGTDSDFPDDGRARSGSKKLDDTPHRFTIGGHIVESYFSPSDRTTKQIERQLLAADRSMEFALLSFTRNDLGDAVLDAWQRGVEVRGFIDNSGDQGSEYGRLLNAGVPVDDHSPSTQIHHKYAIIDAHYPDDDPVLITGSHNWSTSAEEDNDENTLIIHDPEIVNLFIQEFEARWGSEPTSINEVVLEGSLQLYPQPAENDLYVRWKSNRSGRVKLRMLDQSGRQVLTSEALHGMGVHIERLDIRPLLPGWYTLQLFDPNSGVVWAVEKVIKQ